MWFKRLAGIGFRKENNKIVKESSKDSMIATKSDPQPFASSSVLISWSFQD